MTAEPLPSFIKTHARTLVALAALLAVATFLRMQQLSSMEFKHDEAVNSALARGIATGEHFPAAGMHSSAGNQNPPFFTYLLSVPFLFSSDPVFAAAFIALINVAGVLLMWLVGSLIGGRTVAWSAAIVLAVHPWAIHYSRKIWQQDLLVPFLLAYFYCCLQLVQHQRPWLLMLAALLLSLVTQLHLSAAILGILLVIASYHARAQLRPWHYPAAIIILLLPYIPYFIADAHRGWANLNTILHGGRVAPIFQPQAFWTIAELASGWAHLPDPGWGVHVFVWTLLAIGVAVCVRRPRQPAHSFLLLWLILQPLTVAFSRMTFQSHYLLPAFPAAVLVGIIGFDRLLHRIAHRTAFRRAGLLLGVACGCAFALCSWRLNRTAASSSNIKWDGYGVPFRQHLRDIRAELKAGRIRRDQLTLSPVQIARIPAPMGGTHHPAATAYIVSNLNSIRNW